MMWRNHKKALIWSCYATFTVQHWYRSHRRKSAALPVEFGCPVWVYDAQIIRRRLQRWNSLMWCASHRKPVPISYFALNAWAGRESGFRLVRRIERALAAGYNPQTHPDDIVLLQMLSIRRRLNASVNCKFRECGFCWYARPTGSGFARASGWLRVNPGFGHGHSQKTNTGAKTASTVSGTPICPPHWTWYTSSSTAGRHSHAHWFWRWLCHLEQVCGAMVRQVLEFGQDYRLFLRAVGFLFLINRVKRRWYRTLLWSVECRAWANRPPLGHPVKLEIEPGRFLVAQAGD